MSILVIKFGGTSVRYGGNHLIDIVNELKLKWDKIIIVVSALSQVTNMLLNGLQEPYEINQQVSKILEAHLELLDDSASATKDKVKSYLSEYHQLVKKGELTPKIKDKIAAYGEFMSLETIGYLLQRNDIEHNIIASNEFIRTDESYTDALVCIEDTQELIDKKLLNILKTTKIILTNGFVGETQNGDITTLGRGGSDYTASLIGSMVNAEEVRIYSDVNGMMTGDPKKIKSARLLKAIDIKEAAELSFFGAKILHPKTVQPLVKRNTKLKILNTFDKEQEGTVICNNLKGVRNPIIAVSSISNIELITVEGNGILGRVGVASRIFETVSKLGISIPFITQASSETSICFAIKETESDIVIEEIEKTLKKEIECDYVQNIANQKEVSLITIIGANMIKTPGIAGKIFTQLGDNNINIIAISQGSSELSITIVVLASDEIKALNILHNLL